MLWYARLPLLLLCLLHVFRHASVLSFFVVCVARPCFAHPSCVSRFPLASCSAANNVFRLAHSPALAADGNQCRVKGCRTAVRAKFGEGPRTRGDGTTPTHIEGYAHNTRVLSPVLGHDRIYEEGALISKNFAGNFEQHFYKKIRRGNNINIYVIGGEKSKTGFRLRHRDYSYRAWKALCTLDLLYNHPTFDFVQNAP